jgi:hypothetical protein
VGKLEDQSTFSSQRMTDLLDFMGNGIPVNGINSAAYMIADDL